MNRAEGMTYPWSEALAELFAGAWAPVAASPRKLAEARRRAQAVEDLERLSDRALYDIGLHRSQIRAAVHGEPS